MLPQDGSRDDRAMPRDQDLGSSRSTWELLGVAHAAVVAPPSQAVVCE